MFKDIYRGKKVLVTGNTGFKGSWLTVWLLKMGASVYGISNEIPTKPSMFEVLELEKKINHHYADIRNLEKVVNLFGKINPDFVFTWRLNQLSAVLIKIQLRLFTVM